MHVFLQMTDVFAVDYDSDFEDKQDKGKGTATADPYAGKHPSSGSLIYILPVSRYLLLQGST